MNNKFLNPATLFLSVIVIIGICIVLMSMLPSNYGCNSEECNVEIIPLSEQVDRMSDEELKDFIEHVRICDSLNIDQYKAFRYLLQK